MTNWQCNKCGYSIKADAPPEKCPSCSSECSFIDNSCYTPDCQGMQSDPRIKKQNENR